MLRRAKGTCLALTLFALLAWAPSALAVTPVTCANLQTAIDGAAAGAVLQLPAGTCSTNTNTSNTNAFTLEGAGGGGTVLQPIDPTTPMIQSSADVKFTLTGLTFTKMTSNAAVSLTGAGEAVTVSGDTFTGNRDPNGFGGAISIQTFKPSTASGPTVITGNTFSGNQAGSGGAVAALASPVPLVISNNTFTGNSSGITGGGALLVSNDQGGTNAVRITGNTFGGPGAGAGNTTHYAGGAAVIELAHGQSLTLASNTFQANKITGARGAMSGALREGGALFLAPVVGDTAFGVTQSHNTFTGNVIDETQNVPTPALTAGGAGEWILGLTVNSSYDTFTGNRIAVHDGAPPEGGALGAYAAAAAVSPPTPALPAAFNGTNDLFLGNSTAAGGWGGAIYVGIPPANCTGTCPANGLTLNDSTVFANSVDAAPTSEGGGIWGSPNDLLTLNNTILYANPPHPELFGFGATTLAIAYSDVCLETGGPTIPLHVGNICADPKLGLAGAETAASPTIDAGSNALIPAGLTTDVLGNPRIRANRLGCAGLGPATVDIGAYEFTGISIPPPCPPPIDSFNPVVGIGAGSPLAKNGSVAIRLSCPGRQSYCDGTVELDTVRLFAALDAASRKPARRHLVLGHSHFHIVGGHSAQVKIKLSASALRKLGARTFVPLVINVADRDAARRRATSHQAVTLRLPRKRRRGH